MPEEIAIDLTVPQAVEHAVALHKAGKLDDAEQWLRLILDKADRNCFDAMVHLGNVLADRGSYYEALYRFDRALKINRRSPLALSNHAMVLGELKHYEEALAELHIAAHLEPKNPVIWNNIGNTLVFLRRYPQAIAALRKALSLEPMHLLSHYNLGVAYLRNGEHKEGIKELERALMIAPDYPEARFNLGLGQLVLGDFENGFANYESRWRTIEYAGYHKRFPQEKWSGEPADLAGQSIVVYGDQGLGDSIHFCRYLPMFVAAGAKVYGVAHKPLGKLFRDTFQDIEFLEHGTEMPKLDYRCSFPSAPHAFKARADNIPPPVPFRIDDALSSYWRNLLKFSRPGPRVGVTWHGSWQHENDASRSIALSVFRHLFIRMDGVTFYSLQYEPRPSDQKDLDECADLVRLPIRSFEDTCAIVQQLDLVVTVDTSVAHLAATMGVPTWILISTPRVDWRWQLNRSDSPWYPSVALYRQDREGDWPAVIQRVKRDLRAQVERRAA